MHQLTEQLRHVLHIVRERLLLADADTVVAELGISKSNVYRIRNGGTPSIQTLELLAYYFDTGCRLGQSPEPQPNGKGPALPPAIYPTESQPARLPGM